MFILTKIADLVQITPQDFEKDTKLAIEDNINAKYANKVIQKIGLCVCLYDLLSASEGLIGHGTGLVNVNVEFRLIVFRPFKHEVLLGRITQQSEHHIRIRLPFFDDIIVPSNRLPEGTVFDKRTHLNVWKTDGQDLYYDNHETVRFRIETEEWHDQTPTKPNIVKLEEPGILGQPPQIEEEDIPKSPYSLFATMEDAGLGPCLWWDGDEEAEVEEEL